MKNSSRIQKVAAYYDKIAPEYDQRRYLSDERSRIVDKQATAIFLDYAGRLDAKSVLEIGCGTARFLKASVAQGGSFSVGLDVSRPMLELAQKKLPSARFVQASIFQLPFQKEAFDLVVCSQVLTHLDSYYQPFKEISAVLKNNGTFIFDIRNSLNMINQYFRLLRLGGKTEDGYDPGLASLFFIEKALRKSGLRIVAYRGFSWPNKYLYRFIKKDFTPLLQATGIYNLFASEIMIKAVKARDN